jgi:DNA-binding NtrC family response regulator
MNQKGEAIEKNSSFLLHDIIGISPEPLLIVCQALKVIAANNAAMLLIPANVPITGKTIKEVLCSPDWPGNTINTAIYEQFFSNLQPYTYIRSQLNQLGHKITVQASGRPITCADGTVFLCESMSVLLGEKHTKNKAGKMEMLGQSPAYLAMLSQLKKAANCSIPVLLYGETGTGKEVAAHNIHQLSARSNRPFMVADCTVLSEALFESELFGHEKGAFTGSTGEKKGLIEVADGGTLFFDEIGEMSLTLQTKLLRLLESYSFRRVGGVKFFNADIRIICATNRDLWQMVMEGTFRQDLYYRLAVFQVSIPSLQERHQDIRLLIHSFLAQINAAMTRHLSITEAAADAICQLPLKGNIRELRNLMHYCAAVCNHLTIEVADLPPLAKRCHHNAIEPYQNTQDRHSGIAYPAGQNKDVNPLQQNNSLRLSEQLPDGIVDAVQSRYLSELVHRYNGDKKKVADHLGVSQRTIYRRLASIQEGMRRFIDSES